MRLLLLCLALLAPLAAHAQSDDRGFIQGLLEDALSAEDRTVRVEGFAGALSSRATIDRITVSDPDGIWLTVEDVALVWSRAALLQRRIEIDEISVGRLSLPRGPLPSGAEAVPSPEARGPFTLPQLPVSVSLAQLRVERAEIGAPILGEQAVLRLEGSAQLADGEGSVDLQVDRLDRESTIEVAGSFANETRALDLTLALEEPQGGLAGDALGLAPGEPLSLRVDGDGTLADFAADLTLQTGGVERVGGTVTLLATEAGGQGFRVDVAGDLAPLVAPEYVAFLGDRVALEAEGVRTANGAVTLEALSLDAAALNLQGSAAVASDGWPQRFALEGSIRPPGVGAEDVVLPLPGPVTRVRSITLEAGFDAARDNRWRLTAAVRGLDRPDLRASQVTLDGEGRIDRGANAVDGALTFAANALDPASAALAEAIGDSLAGRLGFSWAPDAPLVLSDMDIGGSDYDLTGAIAVSGVGGAGLDIDVRPDVTLRAEDLSRFAALAGQPLAGAARLEIAGSVQPVGQAFDLRLRGTTRDIETGIAELDGLVAGDGVLALSARRDTTGLFLDALDLQTSGLSVTGTARIAGDDGSARLQARLVEASRVLPGLTGSAEINLAADQQSAEDWQVDLTARGPGEARLRFSGLVDTTAGPSLAGRFEADIDQLSAYRAVARRPLSGALSLEADGTVSLDGPSFDATAEIAGTDLRLGIDQLDRLLGGTTRVTADATLQDGVLDLAALDLDGSQLSATVSGRVAPDGSAIDLDARLANLGLIVPQFAGPVTLGGTAQSDGGPWRVDLTGSGPGGIGVTARGSVAADASSLDLAVDGTAPLALANPFIAPRTLDGTARLDLRIDGPPALSSVSGTISGNGARLALPTLNITVDGIALNARLSGSSATLDIDGRIGERGELSVTGPVGLTGGFPADLAIRLRNGRFADGRIYETEANADITLSGRLAGGAVIGGRVELDQAELRIPQIGPSYQVLDGLRHVAPPADVRRTLAFAGLRANGGAAEPSRQSGSGGGFPIDLTIEAPNRVFVRGRGLDAELGGTIRLGGTTANLVPQGSLDLIRGRLDLLGRRLNLTEAFVGLQGNFDPVVRFAASTSVDGTEITIALSGVASDPDLLISSSPDLPQDEVLALLLFGRDVSQLSALQAIQLASAVRSLSGRGGLGLTEQLREGLGVDDFDVTTDAEGNAQARVGAYISENIYTDLTVGSGGESQITLNLDVTEQVTVRGRVGSDGDTAVGVFFERDY